VPPHFESLAPSFTSKLNDAPLWDGVIASVLLHDPNCGSGDAFYGD
jgi:hypothetical protein